MVGLVFAFARTVAAGIRWPATAVGDGLAAVAGGLTQESGEMDADAMSERRKFG